MPLLAQELQAEEEARRLEAIDLLGRLFRLPGSDMDQEFSFLFEEFVRRSKDQKAGLVNEADEEPVPRHEWIHCHKWSIAPTYTNLQR